MEVNTYVTIFRHLDARGGKFFGNNIIFIINYIQEMPKEGFNLTLYINNVEHSY